MKQPDLKLDLCTTEVFARMCAMPVGAVDEWIEAGMLPSKTISGICLVDLRTFVAAQSGGGKADSARVDRTR